MKRVILSLIVTVVVFGFSSCGGGDEPTACSTAWATELDSEFAGISAAASAFGADQSTANCDALKAAYQTYINALAPYGDCSLLTGTDKEAFNTAVANAQASVDDIC